MKLEEIKMRYRRFEAARHIALFLRTLDVFDMPDVELCVTEDGEIAVVGSKRCGKPKTLLFETAMMCFHHVVEKNPAQWTEEDVAAVAYDIAVERFDEVVPPESGFKLVWKGAK